MNELTDSNKRWVMAPYQHHPASGLIEGVYVDQGEEVEWTWSADGTHIIGYTIVKRS